jgi:hypothetical protein
MLGFVCEGNSNLKVDDLKRSITLYIKDLNLPSDYLDKKKKQDLCKIHELIMRRQKILLRPWLIDPQAKVKRKN